MTDRFPIDKSNEQTEANIVGFFAFYIALGMLAFYAMVVIEAVR